MWLLYHLPLVSGKYMCQMKLTTRSVLIFGTAISTISGFLLSKLGLSFLILWLLSFRALRYGDCIWWNDKDCSWLEFWYRDLCKWFLWRLISYANDQHSATLSSVIRVPYLVHRLFFDPYDDNLFTEFQVDMIRSVIIRSILGGHW